MFHVQDVGVQFIAPQSSAPQQGAINRAPTLLRNIASQHSNDDKAIGELQRNTAAMVKSAALYLARPNENQGIEAAKRP